MFSILQLPLEQTQLDHSLPTVVGLLTDTAHKSRCCTRNSVPTIEKIKKLDLDWIPEVVDIVKQHEESEPPRETLPDSDDAWEL